MQRLERFLRQVLLLIIEELEFYPEVFLRVDALRVCGEFCAEHLWRCVNSIFLPPGFGWIRRSEWCTAYFWSIFPLDCFWVTASLKLLVVIIVSFVCIILTLLMFYVMSDSLSCNIFVQYWKQFLVIVKI